LADLISPPSAPKAFLDTTVPCDRFLGSKATRAHVNAKLASFSAPATCKFVQLEFLLGPWGHLAKLQAQAQAGVPEDELHRTAGKYQGYPANRWQKRVGSVWLNALGTSQVLELGLFFYGASEASQGGTHRKKALQGLAILS
jgi:hypothetical protein